MARLGSLTLAARELAVTPGAISQQLALLSGFFGRELFQRRNNRLQLTDAGRAVYAEASAAMDRLAAITGRLVRGASRPHLVLSALPSVAVRWLNHALGDFIAAAPEVRCELRVEEDPVDFQRHGIDLRLTYGAHLYPDLVSEVLLRDEVTPLCTPAYRQRLGLTADQPDRLPENDLIHLDWGAAFASHPTWQDWFRAAGSQRRLGLERGHRTTMSSLAIDLAAAGAGVALGQRLLARADLEAGRLVAPFAATLALPHPYCLVHPPGRADKPALRRLVAWLRARL